MVTAQDKMKENFEDQVFSDMDLVDVDDALSATMERDIASLDYTAPVETSPWSRMFMNIPTLIAALFVAVIGLVVFQILQTQQNATKTHYAQTTSQLMMLSQGIAKDAREAVLGASEAFVRLRDQSERFAAQFEALGVGGKEKLLSPGMPDVGKQLKAVDGLWSATSRDVDTILVHETVLTDVPNQVKQIDELAPLLLAKADEVVEAVVRESKDPEQVNIAGRQRSLSQRIAKDVNIVSKGGEGAAVAASQVAKDTNLFEVTNQQLRNSSGPVVQAKLDALDSTFGEVKTSVASLLGSVSEYFLAYNAADNILVNSDSLLASVRTLSDAYTGESQNQYYKWLPWVFGALTAIFSFLLIRAVIVVARRRAEENAHQNRETQDAILKLLDEMGDLADGDLTIEAEVTDQITGAIADSVNFAVREMRSLVRRINEASQQVAAASMDSANTAKELSTASEKQAQDITETSEHVQNMAKSMEEMSAEARRSAEVAQGSVEVANRGAEAARTNIRGMDEMRQQIQETSKRIKRLGESSQQIGEIVRLISDIAEQTNILSLNAAIQAAMAGDAGRGFAVVADEVQRLAERSTAATKDISELVKNIQSDTNEAVISMEHATQGVVEGTRLVDSAGQALGEIESVSEELSRLITTMAEAAQQQSQTATNVSDRMTAIRDVTKNTSIEAQETAELIGKLTNLALGLQESVAGFKLPA